MSERYQRTYCQDHRQHDDGHRRPGKEILGAKGPRQKRPPPLQSRTDTRREKVSQKNLAPADYCDKTDDGKDSEERSGTA